MHVPVMNINKINTGRLWVAKIDPTTYHARSNRPVGPVPVRTTVGLLLTHPAAVSAVNPGAIFEKNLDAALGAVLVAITSQR